MSYIIEQLTTVIPSLILPMDKLTHHWELPLGVQLSIVVTMVLI